MSEAFIRKTIRELKKRRKTSKYFINRVQTGFVSVSTLVEFFEECNSLTKLINTLKRELPVPVHKVGINSLCIEELQTCCCGHLLERPLNYCPNCGRKLFYKDGNKTFKGI